MVYNILLCEISGRDIPSPELVANDEQPVFEVEHRKKVRTEGRLFNYYSAVRDNSRNGEGSNL